MVTRESNIKAVFVQSLKDSLNELQSAVSTRNLDWTIRGFVDIHKNLFSVSDDTKVVSKIMEIQLLPLLNQIGNKMGYDVQIPETQNCYPDVTFINREDNNIKFAVDFKTTYRKGGKNSKLKLTLGSHGGYFDGSKENKNTLYPYQDYLGHFCFVILYSRIKKGKEKPDPKVVYKINELGAPASSSAIEYPSLQKDKIRDIVSVIKNVKFCFVEKWKIASDGQGSGNTANIGASITEADLEAENGAFSKLGERYFHEYWCNYNKAEIILEDGQRKKITNIWDFLAFKNEKTKFSLIGNGAKTKPEYYND